MKYVRFVSDKTRNLINMRSNVVLWDNKTNSELAPTVLAGTYPPSFVQPLLHEGCHYWCANSPLGRAIHLLWLKYLAAIFQSDFIRLGGVEGKHVFAAARVASIEAILRPLAEGLALFAEFDFCPKEKWPRQHASALYGLALKMAVRNEPKAFTNDVTHPKIAIARYLRHSKLASHAYLRKANILCHPLAPKTSEQSYLIGYLLVKALFDKVRQDSHGEIDAEFFLKYMRSYIYEDWRLVSLVLNDAADVTAESSAILQYVIDRLRRLHLMDTWAQMLVYEKAIIAGGSSRNIYDQQYWESLPGLGLTVEDAGRGAQALDTTRDDISHNANNLVGAAVAFSDLGHSLLTLIDLDVNVSVDASGTVKVTRIEDHAFIASLPSARFEVRSESGRGRMLAFLSDNTQPFALIRCVTLKDQLAGIWSDTRLTQDYARRLEQILDAGVSAQHLFNGLFVIDRMLHSSEISQDILEEECDEASELCGSAYARLLRETDQSVSKLLKISTSHPKLDSGVRRLFPSGSLLDAYSLLSVCNSWTDSAVEVSRILADEGFSLSEVIEHAVNTRAKTGFKLCEIADQTVRAVF